MKRLPPSVSFPRKVRGVVALGTRSFAVIGRLLNRRSLTPPLNNFWQAFLFAAIVLFIAALLQYPKNARAQNEQAEGKAADFRGTTVSAEVREFIARRWDATSFERGLSLLQNRNESIESRRLILDTLRSKRTELTPEASKRFLNENAVIAKDLTESPILSAAAVRTITSLIVLAKEKDQITKSDVKRDFSFLTEIARDKTRDADLRGAALRATGDLGIEEARILLRELLADPIESDRPEIARNALLAIWRLEGKDAIDAISEVLGRTQNPAIFGTAAFSLGQIKTVESMVKLVQHRDRFPDSASTDAVLVDMEEIILSVLQNPQDRNVSYAINATRHLWREGQRERYVPLLRGLIRTASMAARKAALDRLLEAASVLEFEAEKHELGSILPVIGDQPELSDYVERIRRRLSAKVLVPSRRDTPVPVIR